MKDLYDVESGSYFVFELLTKVILYPFVHGAQIKEYSIKIQMFTINSANLGFSRFLDFLVFKIFLKCFSTNGGTFI